MIGLGGRRLGVFLMLRMRRIGWVDLPMLWEGRTDLGRFGRAGLLLGVWSE